METLSSNHYSHDMQVADVLNTLRYGNPTAYTKLTHGWPEIARLIFDGAAFDTDAMGVDIEFGAWVADDIEWVTAETYANGTSTHMVKWWEGEPWYVTHTDVLEMYDLVD